MPQITCLTPLVGLSSNIYPGSFVCHIDQGGNVQQSARRREPSGVDDQTVRRMAKAVLRVIRGRVTHMPAWPPELAVDVDIASDNPVLARIQFLPEELELGYLSESGNVLVFDLHGKPMLRAMLTSDEWWSMRHAKLQVHKTTQRFIEREEMRSVMRHSLKRLIGRLD